MTQGFYDDKTVDAAANVGSLRTLGTGANQAAAGNDARFGLTGFVQGAGTVSGADTILQAVQKLDGNDTLKANIASPTFTGAVTLPANQTLITPTISGTGFTNAQHAHAGATSGGQLNLAQIGGATILPTANGGTGSTAFAGDNAVLNGNFVDWSRGAGPFTASGTFCADRWIPSLAGDMISISRGVFTTSDPDPLGSQETYFIQAAVTAVVAASNYAVLENRINDVRTYAGETVTLSFLAKAASGNPVIGLECIQYFGTGGSANVNGICAQPQQLTTSWTQYSKTFVIPSINGKTIGIDHSLFARFWLDADSAYNARTGGIGAQASKTVSITRVKLERGAAVTSWKVRAVPEEVIAIGAPDDSLVVGSRPFIEVIPAGAYNVAHNWKFDIWTRATSFAAPAANAFLCDRWSAPYGTAARTISRQAGFSGAKYCTRVQRDSGSSTTGNYGIFQVTEGVDVYPLQGKYVTLSFDARCGANYSPTSSYLFVSMYSGTTEDQGVSVWPSWAGQVNLGQSNFVLTTTAASYSVTVAVPSNALELGTTFLMVIPAGTAGAADYFEVTNVKIQIGSSPSISLPRTIQQEIGICQRFLPSINSGSTSSDLAHGVAVANNSAYIYCRHMVESRVGTTGVGSTAASGFNCEEYPGVGNAVLSAVAWAAGRSSKNMSTIQASTASTVWTLYRSMTLMANSATAAIWFTGAEL